MLCKPRNSLVLLLLGMAVTWSSEATAQYRYRLIDIGDLGGPESRAWAINESSAVAGDARLPLFGRAVVYENGTLTEFGTLGGDWSHGRDLNDQGWVVGDAADGNQLVQPALFQGQQVTSLVAATGTANGINNLGQVVGFFGGTNSRAFLWDNGSFTDLGTMGGGSWAIASAINDAGIVVGSSEVVGGDIRGFYWNGNNYVDLGDLGDRTRTSAYDINELNQIVGESSLFPSAQRAFLWQNGQMTNLGGLGGGHSAAYAINAESQIVGHSLTATGISAFLWESGVMRDLNDLIDPNSGYHLKLALDINDRGEIVGTADLQGEERGFLLIPNVLVGPTPGVAGVQNTIELYGGQPGERAFFLFGESTGSAPVKRCTGLTIGLLPPLRAVGPFLFDASGIATLRTPVPGGWSGKNIYIEGVNQTSCWVSGLVTHTWQ